MQHFYTTQLIVFYNKIVVSDCILCYSDSLKYYLLLTTVLKYASSEM